MFSEAALAMCEVGSHPLTEQTAIVAQVERLLGLVGQLEAEAAGQAEGLLQAALREAMGA